MRVKAGLLDHVRGIQLGLKPLIDLEFRQELEIRAIQLQELPQRGGIPVTRLGDQLLGSWTLMAVHRHPLLDKAMRLPRYPRARSQRAVAGVPNSVPRRASFDQPGEPVRQNETTWVTTSSTERGCARRGTIAA